MDISEIIKKINDSNKANSFLAWCPTLDKFIKLTGFTTGHHQTFIKNMLESPFVNAPFTISSAKAIGEVWMDDIPFSPDQLTILDKTTFLMEIWINTYHSEKTTEIKKTRQIVKTKPLEDEIITSGEYSVNIQFPSILKEAQYAKFTQNWVQENVPDENKEKVSELNSLFYVLEPLIFINKLSINGDHIDINALPVENQLEIGKLLPPSLISSINASIKNKFRPVLEEIKTIEINGKKEIVELNNLTFVITE